MMPEEENKNKESNNTPNSHQSNYLQNSLKITSKERRDDKNNVTFKIKEESKQDDAKEEDEGNDKTSQSSPSSREMINKTPKNQYSKEVEMKLNPTPTGDQEETKQDKVMWATKAGTANSLQNNDALNYECINFLNSNRFELNTVILSK